MSIHDELLMVVPASITKEQIEEIQETMENAIQLCVPMTTDAEIGHKWGQCRKVSEFDFIELEEEL